MKKFTVLWLKKPHAYSREAELFCFWRYCRADTRPAQVFWCNCHLLFTFLSDLHRKQETP